MSSTGILQVVNGDGEFNEEGVNGFIEQHNIRDVGVGYQVIAITGPQSSGKSTLMNALVSSPMWHLPNLSNVISWSGTMDAKESSISFQGAFPKPYFSNFYEADNISMLLSSLYLKISNLRSCQLPCRFSIVYMQVLFAAFITASLSFKPHPLSKSPGHSAI